MHGCHMPSKRTIGLSTRWRDFSHTGGTRLVQCTITSPPTGAPDAQNWYCADSMPTLAVYSVEALSLVRR